MRFPGQVGGYRITTFNGFRTRSSKCNLTPIGCSNWGTRGGILCASHWCKVLCFRIGPIFSCCKQTAPNPNPDLFCNNWRRPCGQKGLLSKQRTLSLPHGLCLKFLPQSISDVVVYLYYFMFKLCCENTTEYPQLLDYNTTMYIPNCTNPIHTMCDSIVHISWSPQHTTHTIFLPWTPRTSKNTLDSLFGGGSKSLSSLQED